MLKLLPAVGAVAVLAPVALSAIIHNTFGPRGDYSLTQWHTATGATTAAPASVIAVPFTVPAGAYSLRSVSLAVRWPTPTLPVASVRVCADGGGKPGTLVEALPMLTPFLPGGTAVQVGIYSQKRPVLAPGATYWVELSVPPGASIHWYDNVSSATGFVSGGSAQGWTIDATKARQPVLRIDAVPIPAPAPIALAAVGLLACTRRRRE